MTEKWWASNWQLLMVCWFLISLHNKSYIAFNMAVMLIALKQSWYLSEKHVKIYVICVIFMQFYGIRSCTVLRAADLGYTGFPTSRFAPPARIDPKSTTSVTQGPTNLLVYVDICSYAVLLRISKFVCLKNCGRGFFWQISNLCYVEIWEWLRESTIENMDFGNENILILSHKISMLKY